MDWVAILGLLLAGGGAGGLIKAISDYYKQQKESNSTSQEKSLEGCLKLFDEAKERITQLESQVMGLQSKFIESVTHQTEEGKENIRAVASLTEQLKGMKNTLNEYELRIKDQSDIIEILGDNLRKAQAEIISLKKKLREYKNTVN